MFVALSAHQGWLGADAAAPHNCGDFLVVAKFNKLLQFKGFQVSPA